MLDGVGPNLLVSAEDFGMDFGMADRTVFVHRMHWIHIGPCRDLPSRRAVVVPVRDLRRATEPSRGREGERKRSNEPCSTLWD